MRRFEGVLFALVMGALSGLLGYLSFWGIGEPAVSGWVGLLRVLLGCLSVVPLGVVAGRLGAGWNGAGWRRAGVVGLGVTGGQCWVWAVWQGWVLDVSGAGYFGFVPYLAGYSGLFVVLGGWMVWRWGIGVAGKVSGVLAGLGLAAAWGVVEHLRGEVVFSGYSFYLVGHSLIDVAGGWGVGRVLGAGGGSALVGGAGVCLGLWLVVRRRGVLVVGGGLAGALVLAGVVGVVAEREGERGEAVRVGVVQTNVEQSVKGGWGAIERLESLQSLNDLSERGVEAGAEVLVWPETMFPGADFDEASAAVWSGSGLGFEIEGGGFLELSLFRDEVLLMSRRLGVPVVLGARASEGLRLVEVEGGGVRPESDGSYNSVFVVDDGVVGDRYDKVRLTPFGETIPYIGEIEWLESLVLSVGVGASGMSFDLESGVLREQLVVGVLGGVAAPVCFEATMAGHCVDLVGGPDGAGVLVNLTNDGWFGGSLNGRGAHLLSARWRSAELGRPMVRSANTGLSALVDDRGLVTGWLGSQEAGVLVGDVVPVRGRRTVFEVVGRWWWVVVWGGFVVLLGAGWRWGEGRTARAGTDGGVGMEAA